MGNQKLKWTAEEEEALLAGIEKHGHGKWKIILRDPDFAHSLSHRSNIDLKDKWRNLNVNTATQGSRERAPKSNTFAASPIKPAPAVHSALPDVSPAIIIEDPSNGSHEAKNAPRYNNMITDALATLNDTNGSDLSAIVGFLQQRYEVPQNVRRLLGPKLRRLIQLGKIEKAPNGYKLIRETGQVALPIRTPIPKQREINKPPPTHSSPGLISFEESVEEASNTAAYMVVDAENKSFLAAEAVKEAESISKMEEETDAMLQLVKEIYKHCLQGGNVILA